MAIITLLEMGMITSMMTIMVIVPVIKMSCVVSELLLRKTPHSQNKISTLYQAASTGSCQVHTTFK